MILTLSDRSCTLRADSGEPVKAPSSSSPLMPELSHQTVRSHVDVNEARLLPRYRDVEFGVLASHRRTRAQADAILDAIAEEPSGRPLRDALTKPGDPDQLRGIPAIGRSVSGAIRTTDPERETLRRISHAETLREKTQAA